MISSDENEIGRSLNYNVIMLGTQLSEDHLSTDQYGVPKTTVADFRLPDVSNDEEDEEPAMHRANIDGERLQQKRINEKSSRNNNEITSSCWKAGGKYQSPCHPSRRTTKVSTSQNNSTTFWRDSASNKAFETPWNTIDGIRDNNSYNTNNNNNTKNQRNKLITKKTISMTWTLAT